MKVECLITKLLVIEVHGKQVLSAFDVITRENSTWNKFDF